MSTNVLDYKLCYVSDNIAWFTSIPLEKQWGDDWNDAPYQHNASPPYDTTRQGDDCINHDLVRIAYYGSVSTPADFYQEYFSIEMINRGEVPWLRVWGEGGEGLKAGSTVKQFLEYAKRVEIETFLPEVVWDALLVQRGVDA